MASLWARLRKARRVYGFAPFTQSLCESVLDRVERLDEPVLVNVQDISNRLDGKEVRYGDVAQDITPCHPELWLEFITLRSCSRVGIWVSRIDCSLIPKAIADEFPIPDNTRFLIQFTTLIEHDIAAAIASMVFVYIGDTGTPLADFHVHMKEWEQQSLSMYVLGCEVLTTMNTRGTRIEPPLDKPSVRVVKPNRAPCSVWHTIHIPKFRSEPLGLPSADEVVEKREHWVRAHRADYREGKGLFGRIHGLVWIPEHRRGNPELGTVKQIFEVSR